MRKKVKRRNLSLAGWHTQQSRRRVEAAQTHFYFSRGGFSQRKGGHTTTKVLIS
jgi:hypothetical protein